MFINRSATGSIDSKVTQDDSSCPRVGYDKPDDYQCCFCFPCDAVRESTVCDDKHAYAYNGKFLYYIARGKLTQWIMSMVIMTLIEINPTANITDAD